jgi:hypothetical protein
MKSENFKIIKFLIEECLLNTGVWVQIAILGNFPGWEIHMSQNVRISHRKLSEEIRHVKSQLNRGPTGRQETFFNH